MKKIMFNDKFGLTQAVFDGHKTMTRRCVPNKIVDEWWDYLNTCAICHAKPLRVIEHARYQVGEVVAIAQAYKSAYEKGTLKLEHNMFAGVFNKMFVKAELMPHHIRITNIRVERLQDISDEDCLKEGIRTSGFVRAGYHITDCVGITKRFSTPREAFAALIDKVSGKGTWERNPYVFVYEFELVD